MPQPAARLRCFNAMASGRTTSARKAHLRMTLEGGVRRGVAPRLLVLMVRLMTERYFRAFSHWKCYGMMRAPRRRQAYSNQRSSRLFTPQKSRRHLSPRSMYPRSRTSPPVDLMTVSALRCRSSVLCRSTCVDDHGACRQILSPCAGCHPLFASIGIVWCRRPVPAPSAEISCGPVTLTRSLEMTCLKLF